jgi:DNA segregation ATPase FtsK/SpoIIIE-like protein
VCWLRERSAEGLSNRQTVNHRQEISSVVFFAVAILFGAAYYWPDAKTGWLGGLLLTIGKGFLGVGAYAVPALLLFISIEFLLGKNIRKANLRATFVTILLISITSVLHLATVDQLALQARFLDDGGTMVAGKAVIELWRTGVDPALVPNNLTWLGSMAWTGGLVPGLVAQSMLALAGPVGALILTVALMLAFVVLIFNISYTRTIQNTAQAIKQTTTQVDSAVRAGIANAKSSEVANDLRTLRTAETRAAAERMDTYLADSVRQQPTSAFDFEIPVDTAEDTRRSLLQGWQEFWQKRTLNRKSGDEPSSASDTGGFAFTGGTPADPTVSHLDLNEDEAKVANFLSASKLPYTLSKDKNGFLTIAPAESKSTEPLTATPDVAATSHNTSPSVAFPAAQPARTESQAKPFSETVDKSVELKADGEAVDTEQSDRSVWTDRSELDQPKFSFGTPAVNRKVAPGGQLSIDLPYAPPPLHLLKEDHLQQNVKNNQSSIQQLGRKLEDTLKSFGVEAKVVNYTTGPTITRFELSPGPGVKVSRIVNLADDIALNLAAMGVRIEAPIPGKAAIGIEIPNKETMPVLLRSLLESPEFQNASSPLTAAIGRDIQGNPLLCDIAKMPHMLIAGATGSGKSVCINSILMSILFKSNPDQVKMLMIDPKVVELNIYNGIPHLIHPVVTDPKKAAGTLQWAVNEMVRRYTLFADKSVRDIASYNASVGLGLDPDEDEEKLPLILLVIDELSDLMATTPTEVEDAIARLTAMARAAGIHLIIATQRPSVDVITGVIKANIPSRVAFAVASQIDSRTILDMAGAEKLLGKGDMLYYPQSAAKPIRGQGAFVTDAEVERIIAHVKSLHKSSYDQKVADAIQATSVGSSKKDKDDSGDNDELLPQALQICVETGYASVSLLQRRMTVGYPRAARLIDRMHELGYIGGFEGSKPRKVLISLNQLLEMQMKTQIEANEDRS